MSGQLPLVSVCVPVFNGADFLADCLRSIALQTGVRLEIVVLDNNSHDATGEVACAVAEQFPAISWRIERNSETLPMAENWNAALSLSTGEFLKLMCHDDFLEPDALRKQAAALAAHPDCVLCGCDAFIANRHGKKLFIRRKGWKNGVISDEQLFKKAISHGVNPLGEPGTVLGTRDAFFATEGFYAPFRYFVDADKWLRMVRGSCAFWIAEPLCTFRLHRNAASVRLQGKAYSEFLEMCERVAPGAAFCRSPFLRKWKMHAESLARLALYHFCG